MVRGFELLPYEPEPHPDSDVLAAFDGVWPPPGGDRFPVHTITITEVLVYDDGTPDWDSPSGEPIEYDYELDHGECPFEECSVWMDLREGGSLRDVLMGASYYWGGEEKQPWPWRTTYYVKTWTSTHDIPGEPIEYDQGLDVSTVRSDLE